MAGRSSSTPAWLPKRLGAIVDAGRSLGAIPAGLGARDTLRLEAAMPLYGHELTEKIDPYQAGLAFAVDLESRSFPGQKALVELRVRKDRPVRVGWEMAGRRVPREGYSVIAGGQSVGHVTSGTFSPPTEKPIAMGLHPSRNVADCRARKWPSTCVVARSRHAWSRCLFIVVHPQGENRDARQAALCQEP